MVQALAGVLLLALVAAATPSPTGSPCPRTLKFGGALYLDADSVAQPSDVGELVGTTDPNPAQCGLPDRLQVYRHRGHDTGDEVVFYVAPQQAEVFRSGGATGFPFQDVLKWLVLLLVIGILLFAVLPAVFGHMRNPPIALGYGEGGKVDPGEGPPGT
jgi:hypothetical protein